VGNEGVSKPITPEVELPISEIPSVIHNCVGIETTLDLCGHQLFETVAHVTDFEGAVTYIAETLNPSAPVENL